MDCLGGLLNCKFQFSGSGIGPGPCITSKLPGEIGVAGVKTHSEKRECKEDERTSLNQESMNTYCLIHSSS